MSFSKNLGQVVGIYVGTTAPTNPVLIWYDNTPAIMCHKIYDYSIEQWVILNQELIASITYSELTNIATTEGLTIGKFYYLSDIGGYLALSVTQTKVQYVDLAGNLILDDLGSSKQYFVPSGNLSIESLTGTFDETTKKLDFVHDEPESFNGTDFIFGKTFSGGLWKLAKIKFSNLISSVTGNSITWNSGLFFNFNSAFSGKLNVAGGAVGYNEYLTDQSNISSALSSLNSNKMNKVDFSSLTERVTTQIISQGSSWRDVFLHNGPYVIEDDRLFTDRPDNLQIPIEDEIIKYNVYSFSVTEGGFPCALIQKLPNGSKYLLYIADDNIVTAEKFIDERDYEYDFVVHDNSELLLLDGATFNKVLLKKYDYEFTFDGEDAGLNLSGIKEIIGEPGSNISFKGSPKLNVTFEDKSICILGADDYNQKIRNVTIRISSSIAQSVIGFKNFNNIVDCTVISEGVSSVNTEAGFYSCENLFNCRVINNLKGYKNCKNVLNCFYNSDENRFNSGYDYIGFEICENLVNCKFDFTTNDDFTKALGNVIGFKNCTQLCNCISNQYKGLHDSSISFDNCINLNNCGSFLGRFFDSPIAGEIISYQNCQSVNSCQATSALETNWGGTIYGVKDCVKVVNCLVGGFPPEAVGYDNSSSTFEYNITYACGDTAEGGFNASV